MSLEKSNTIMETGDSPDTFKTLVDYYDEIDEMVENFTVLFE